eukprot:tig00000269_g23781.t1
MLRRISSGSARARRPDSGGADATSSVASLNPFDKLNDDIVEVIMLFLDAKGVAAFACSSRRFRALSREFEVVWMRHLPRLSCSILIPRSSWLAIPQRHLGRVIAQSSLLELHRNPPPARFDEDAGVWSGALRLAFGEAQLERRPGLSLKALYVKKLREWTRKDEYRRLMFGHSGAGGARPPGAPPSRLGRSFETLL